MPQVGFASTPAGRVRPCRPDDFEEILEVINRAARAYRGVIPQDRWSDPYMPADELRDEIRAGVAFHGWAEGGRLLGVMGLQTLDEVSLVRHAYVRPEEQGRGIGSALLTHLLAASDRPFLVGTWAAAEWAIRFYRKHGFRRVAEAEKDRLLRAYWSVPARQVETSVVLAGPGWAEEAP